MDAQPGQTTVYEISDQGFGDAIEIRQIVQLLQIQNSQQVRESLEENDAETAALIVRNSLLTRLVLLISRAFSDSRDSDLHIGRAIALLKDGAVRAEIETRGPPGSVTHALEIWTRLKGDHRLWSILHFRDKYTAHLGNPKPHISLPEYQQKFDFAREASNLMSVLAIATGAKTEGIDTWDDELHLSASSFWSPWLAD